jgi:hypothetical protein
VGSDTHGGHSKSPVDVEESCRPTVAAQRQDSALCKLGKAPRAAQYPLAASVCTAVSFQMLVGRHGRPRTVR